MQLYMVDVCRLSHILLSEMLEIFIINMLNSPTITDTLFRDVDLDMNL